MEMNPVLQETQLKDCDNFKKLFKYFKSKKPVPSFSSVLNCHHFNHMNSGICLMQSCILPPELETVRQNLGIRSPNDWNIYSFKCHSGLQIICNAFTDYSSMIWIKKCLQEFTGHPYKTNLSNLGLCSDKESWWSLVKENLIRNSKQKLINQMRWATIGYHHNWDTKVYSIDEKSPVPDELEDLCKLFLCGAGHNYSKFKAEASIVNYYPPGTTLSPHTDHSEPCKQAPLLSFSFGRSGIFLIGGKDRNQTPTPIYLHHGDVMIMSGDSRLCYHAVPRIISEEDIELGLVTQDEQVEFVNKWHEVLLNSEKKSTSENGNATNHEKINLSNIFSNSKCFDDLLNEEECCLDHDDILAILNYIRTVRININVRQVND